ncbi:hypothetical protein U1Q18_044897 [Sarracenia purpurea var. burkii]
MSSLRSRTLIITKLTSTRAKCPAFRSRRTYRAENRKVFVHFAHIRAALIRSTLRLFTHVVVPCLRNHPPRKLPSHLEKRLKIVVGTVLIATTTGFIYYKAKLG